MSRSRTKPWEHAKSGEGSASDPLAARFVESLSYDTRLYDADIRGSLAHAAMLKEVGLIDAGDLAAIQRGLAEVRREIESAPAGARAVDVPGAWPGWDISHEDVHMCIEAALIAKVGDTGRKLHTGRSRNDQVALDLLLWLRSACGEVAGAVDSVLYSLELLAAAQGGIVMSGYTHMQRAQPICLGGELMAWHAMLSRDRAEFLRLAGAGDDGVAPGSDLSPLGSGAVAGSSLPLDRDMTAAALGFAGPSMSSIDSTASRDEALGFLYALSRTAMHLSRLAEQWILYCTTEFGFLALDGRYTTGSSMMPQKRNPDMLELIRGRCGSIYGSFFALMTILKGLPIAYNRDLQEDKRHVFAAYDAAMDCLAMASAIISSATFNQDRIAATLDRGHLDATSLAEYFVNIGVPFRTAHQAVGSLVRACDGSGRHALSELSLEEMIGALREHGIQSASVTSDVYKWLGAEAVVARYRTAGNAGKNGYTEALQAARRERAARPPSPAPPIGPATRRTEAAPATNAGLFNGPLATPPEDEQIIAAYRQVNRTLDDLPYTDEFERLYRAIDGEARGLEKHAVLHRLHNLRKAGRLPKAGRAAGSPPRIGGRDEASLRSLVEQAVGTLGQRDQLPYTEKFESLVEGFNAQTGKHLDPHDVWRLVAKLAK